MKLRELYKLTVNINKSNLPVWQHHFSTTSNNNFYRTSSVNQQNMAEQITTKYLEDKLKKDLGAQYVQAVDESGGCGASFSVIIVSEQFKGKNTLQKHRLVHSALADELKQIHAFSQRSFTPEEWEKVQQQDK